MKRIREKYSLGKIRVVKTIKKILARGEADY
jgi:hypothetical protein